MPTGRVLPARTGRGDDAAVELPARSPEVATDNPLFAPPFVGSQVVKGLSLDEIAAYVNETALFRNQWQFRPESGRDRRRVQGPHPPDLPPAAGRGQGDRRARPPGGVRLLPGQRRRRQDLIVWASEERTDGAGPVPVPPPAPGAVPLHQRLLPPVVRRRGRGRLRRVPHRDHGRAGSAGQTAKLFDENRYQEYLLLHGLGVEMAEALAEYWHHRIRSEWGFVDEDGPVARRAVPPAVPGRALLVGLPRLPRPGGQRHRGPPAGAPSRLGIEVGEETGWQYQPEQTTSAIICHHPRAKYFVAASSARPAPATAVDSTERCPRDRCVGDHLAQSYDLPRSHVPSALRFGRGFCARQFRGAHRRDDAPTTRASIRGVTLRASITSSGDGFARRSCVDASHVGVVRLWASGASDARRPPAGFRRRRPSLHPRISPLRRGRPSRARRSSPCTSACPPARPMAMRIFPVDETSLGGRSTALLAGPTASRARRRAGHRRPVAPGGPGYCTSIERADIDGGDLTRPVRRPRPPEQRRSRGRRRSWTPLPSSQSRCASPSKGSRQRRSGGTSSPAALSVATTSPPGQPRSCSNRWDPGRCSDRARTSAVDGVRRGAGGHPADGRRRERDLHGERKVQHRPGLAPLLPDRSRLHDGRGRPGTLTLSELTPAPGATPLVLRSPSTLR